MNETTFLARVDQPSAGNAAANLKKFDADTNPVVQLNFVSGTLDENGDVFPGGDLTLEQGTVVNPEDPDTLVEVYLQDANGDWQLIGTYEYIYDFSGTTPTVQNQGAGFVPDELEGQDATIITILGYPATTEDTRMFFLPEYHYDPTDPLNSDITIAQMEAFEQGRMNLGNLNNNPVDVCFLSGTILQTPIGSVTVDDLKIGDIVNTTDGGAQLVSWVASSLHYWNDRNSKSKPILVGAGAFGKDLPTHDLLVSPQHHILIKSPHCLALFGQEEVLAPAKGLTGLPGVRVMSGKKSAEYYHVMTEKHEILIAHGVETESFYPGPTAVRMLNAGQRASLFAVVPALRDDPENGYGPTARKRITRRQAEQLVDSMKAETKKNAVAG